MPVIRPTAEDLLVEVDIAAERIKELAFEDPTEATTDEIASHALRGLAALSQLAARRLSR